MLILSNINKTNEYIEANYSPEDSNELAFIKVNYHNGDVLEGKKTVFEEDSNTYASHAKFKLIELAKDGRTVPHEYRVVWY